MLSTTGRKEKLSVSKGSYIEVSSDERNHSTCNVWYHALLQEDLPSSKRNKFSLLHLNPLSNEHYSPPLITTAFHRRLRPVPPPDPSPEAGFEEGDVIDAAHKGGWWSGWVIKALDPRRQRFLVYLRFEPDVIEVERKDMRSHWVWKKEEWFRCEKRSVELEQRWKWEQRWAPGITIKENVDGTLLVKYKSLNACGKENVHNSKIRPSPPSFGFKGFGLMEDVDVLLECGWCPSVVSKVLCVYRYTVLLGGNKRSGDFHHSQLRPSMEWKDGVWQTKEKVSDREESPHAATRGTTVKTPPPRKKLKTMKNQKGCANDSVGENAHEESDNRESVNKRKRGRRPRKFTSTEHKQKTGGVAASDPKTPTPDPMINVVMVEKHVDVVETPKAKETTMVLPFVKKSPCWKVLESMEIFKAVPQSPHFSPLLECEEESREGNAIGAMVKFTGLLEKVSGIQVDDSVIEINMIKECFLKLEKHGFDVTAPCSRIDKLLSIKESQTWALEELKVAEREITEKGNKRRKLEEDIEQMAKKITELQRQLALLKEEKVIKDNEIARIQFHAEVLDRKVQNEEKEFHATVTAPL